MGKVFVSWHWGKRTIRNAHTIVSWLSCSKKVNTTWRYLQRFWLQLFITREATRKRKKYHLAVYYVLSFFSFFCWSAYKTFKQATVLRRHKSRATQQKNIPCDYVKDFCCHLFASTVSKKRNWQKTANIKKDKYTPYTHSMCVWFCRDIAEQTTVQHIFYFSKFYLFPLLSPKEVYDDGKDLVDWTWWIFYLNMFF